MGKAKISVKQQFLNSLKATYENIALLICNELHQMRVLYINCFLQNLLIKSSL